MGNLSCLFAKKICSRVHHVSLQRVLLVLPLHVFYVNEDKMLTQRLLTLGGLESPAFPRALSHARVYCALAGVCLSLAMNLPKVPLVLCP